MPGPAVNLNELSRLVELSHDAIITWTAEGGIRTWNRGATRLYGYTKDEALGRVTHELLQTEHPVAWSVIEDELREAGEWAGELVHTTKDGRRVFISTRHQAIRVDGNVILLETNRDVTYLRQLEHSNRDLQQFAYAASHDLRSPLRGVANLVQFLKEDLGDSVPGDALRHTDELTNQVRRMESLLDDMLSYARVGRDGGASEELDAVQVIAAAVETAALPDRFEVIVPTRPILIRSQRAPLQQVLLNLISNAAKYHDKIHGTIRITTQVDERSIQFTVADDGPGIEARFHESIFGLFQRLHTKDEVEGTGLGLALVRRAVLQVGGEVWVESQPGSGAAFYFTWPKRGVLA